MLLLVIPITLLPFLSIRAHLGKYVESGNRNCTKPLDVGLVGCAPVAIVSSFCHYLRSVPTMYTSKIISLAALAATTMAHFIVPNDDQNMSGIVVNGIPSSVREKYMRLV